MPELPEVETMVRDLEKGLLYQAFEQITVCDSRIIRNCSEKKFIKQCLNQEIEQIFRKGKAIVIAFEIHGFLIIQPMMTGHLILWDKEQKPWPKDVKIVFKLSNGKYFTYNDQRLFGRLNVVEDLSELEFFKSLGPDPFSNEFSVEHLKKQFKKHHGPVKPLLMNQNLVAGIGNIYASEILFSSQISPKRRGDAIRQREIEKLREVTIRILHEAINFRGTSVRNYRDTLGQKGNFKSRIKVYGRENEPCECCGTAVKKIVQSQRSTFYCPGCQT